MKNLARHIHCKHELLLKESFIDRNNEILGYLGYLAPGPEPSHPAPGHQSPIKFSTSSTSFYLKSSHYDHVHITFTGLRVM